MSLFLTNLSTRVLQMGGMLATEGDNGLGLDGKWAWVNNVYNAINSVLWPLLIIVAAAGMIYSVVIGVNMARADSTEQREEAKKKLINVIIGLAVIIGLILFFKLFISTILPAFLDNGSTGTTPNA